MEFEDMRRILRRFDLPAEGFEDVLVKIGRLNGAAPTGGLPGCPPRAPSSPATASGSQAA